MTTIETMDDIQRLVRQGVTDWKPYGEVNVVARGSLRLFNYNTRAQYMNRWNYFEQVSRGLIIDAQSGEIVARPFDKFFNWLEGGQQSEAHIVNVTEKLDGSLGILYRTSEEYRIATRGSFDGPQATWASHFLNTHYDLTRLPDDLTLLFEIVFPGTQTVIRYGGREELVLLAARNRHSGAYLPFSPDVQALAGRYGFALPTIYSVADVPDLLDRIQQLGLEQEGFVAEFADGSRFKFKGTAFLALQKALLGLTYPRVLQAMREGTIQHLLAGVPEEYLVEVRRWIGDIQAVLDDITSRSHTAFAAAPKTSRKAYATWLQAEHADIAKYLFALLDGRPIEPLIYNMLEAAGEDHSGEDS